ncbi:hypothetical protein BO78DRAFT_393057 [Aspergillus sclerotiicarbonarius CBS 121057]|uniref:Uncharacterized protein n=1 Tax=Aspergillus sclerotiicarbonarius (strain CBS 121057 / IBT 28362) TaxID=1448318 RepID=A0A319F1Q6_ASPSB|nr:hypothetical protein BO78DRAFT_393057 [Aspergillus sclerotiicarbonarius CBS 121057]
MTGGSASQWHRSFPATDVGQSSAQPKSTAKGAARTNDDVGRKVASRRKPGRPDAQRFLGMVESVVARRSDRLAVFWNRSVQDHDSNPPCFVSLLFDWP